MQELALSISVGIFADSFVRWRDEARGLLARRIPPWQVQWSAHACGGTLFDGEAFADGSKHILAQRVPRRLLQMLETAACFRADDRWAFLYRILWRWQNGDRTVLSVADEDGKRLHGMVKAVEREAHHMHAFLRFRERAPELGAPRFVAWFEPAHDVLDDAALHFARRMGDTSWLIATPQATVAWDGHRLVQGPPSATGPLQADDEGERLWLTYYRSIFNPARANARAMEMHMPVRFWKNMPESKLIPGLISDAAAGGRCVGQVSAVAARRGSNVHVSADAAQPERPDLSKLDKCRRCDLWRDATQAVPGEGPRKARVMLVGEQPGDQEDIAGKPFVGPAGHLLDRALEAAGLDRNEVYVTNAVKHFKWEPRGKRRMHKTPAQREIDACMLWLDEEMAQIKPEVVVALGSTALKSLMKTSKVSLTKMLGEPITIDDRHIIATYHPSYVLRVPGDEAKSAAFDSMVQAFKRAKTYA